MQVRIFLGLQPLRRGVDFLRLACVLLLACASVLHVVLDFQSLRGDVTMVTSVQGDSGSHDGASAETCHSCSVVSFLEVASPVPVVVPVPVVPEGRQPHRAAFSFALTAPPPRA